jgi:hypothetical protein
VRAAANMTGPLRSGKDARRERPSAFPERGETFVDRARAAESNAKSRHVAVPLWSELRVGVRSCE